MNKLILLGAFILGILITPNVAFAQYSNYSQGGYYNQGTTNYGYDNSGYDNDRGVDYTQSAQAPCDQPAGECWCKYCRYEPCYYCVPRCCEELIPCKKRCCRYVPQYYQVQRCRYVPQYYCETCCRQCPEYYDVEYCRCCKKTVYDRCCKYVPRYYWKKTCNPDCGVQQQQGCCPTGGCAR